MEVLRERRGGVEEGGGRGMKRDKPKSVNFIKGAGKVSRIEVIGLVVGSSNGLEVSRMSSIKKSVVRKGIRNLQKKEVR